MVLRLIKYFQTIRELHIFSGSFNNPNFLNNVIQMTFLLATIVYLQSRGNSGQVSCYVQAIPLVEFRAFLTRWLVQRIW